MVEPRPPRRLVKPRDAARLRQMTAAFDAHAWDAPGARALFLMSGGCIDAHLKFCRSDPRGWQRLQDPCDWRGRDFLRYYGQRRAACGPPSTRGIWTLQSAVTFRCILPASICRRS